VINLKEDQAINLLEETFSNDFDMERFQRFIKELFNHIKIRKNLIPLRKEYGDYVESVTSLGVYRDPNNDVMEVFAVQLKHTSSMIRARTMQRNLIARYLRQFNRKGALVAFYGENPDWRLSFVKMDYQLIKDDSGNLKVEEELTPAKRYSFLVGKNEPSHTCKSQFLERIQIENVDPSLKEIEDIFSVEKVTKDFFSKYKELFLDLKDSIETVIKNDNTVREEFDEKKISTGDFAKKLMGQIVFIYFLQKKGWLGVEKGAEWGTGPKNFIRKLFNGKIVKYNNFFNDLLEPLFYEALASERDDNYYRLFDCKIPFLNGGLFEPLNGYNWVKTDLTIEDSVFEEIFDTFDTFNFTVKEDEPLEREVAVDPEMLGKVFENLLEITDRKSKGAFYTPREIVHYMCQQSLINYLESNSEVSREDLENFIQLGDFALDSLIKEQEQLKKYNKSYEKSILPHSIRENYDELDDLLKNIKVVDPAVGSGAFPVGMMNEIMRARSILAIFSGTERTSYELKREIIEKCLYGVDIDASAVDITKLRFWLSLIVDEIDIHNIKPLPNLDHKIMCGNSLLDEFEGIKLFDEKLLGTPQGPSPKLEAVENNIKSLKDELKTIRNDRTQITRSEEIDAELKKLRRKKKRLIASEENEDIQVGLYEEESKKRLKKLKRLQKEFFNERGSQRKKELRNKIETMEWELINETLKENGNECAMGRLEEYKINHSKPFFLWKLYFAEVFQRTTPGFDVVIANPPYIEFKRLDAEQKRSYNKKYSSAKGKYDIYVIFMELAYDLMNAKGCMTYINPTMFMKRDYGKAIRTFIKNNYQIKKIIDFSDLQVFENATNYTGLFIFTRGNLNEYQFIFKKFKNSKINSTPSEFVNSLYANSKTKICEYMVKDSIDISQNAWNFKDPKIKKILDKLKEDSIFLSDLSVRIFVGIQSGKDEVFYFNEEVIEEFSIEKEIVYPILKGKDVKRYKISWGGTYVLYPYDCNSIAFEEEVLAEKFPNAYKYLKLKKPLLKGRIYFDKSNKKWYELWNQRKIDNLMKTRIITPEISKDNNFMISKDFFGNTKTYHIILKDSDINTYKYILGILNSSLIEFYYHNISVPKAGGFYAYKTQFLKLIPIKFPESNVKKQVVSLVDEILKITETTREFDKEIMDRLNKLNNEINKLAYDIYGLSYDEIQIIKNFKE
jgi:hypothetical protein